MQHSHNVTMKYMQKLHPRAIWMFIFGTGSSSILLTIFIASYFLLELGEIISGDLSGGGIIQTLILLWWVWIPLLIIVHIFVAYLSYYFWRFELRENEYRAERGIIWKRYVSIPYDRIQNVDIHRGLLARILGLSDILIHTAGYGGVGSEGRLPGLRQEHAEQIRDEILEKARHSRNTSI